MHLRPSFLVPAAVACAFAGGFASSRVLERDARAQTAPFASTVYVPTEGLVFRRFDGRMVARLSYDAHGGVFELFDERERRTARMHEDTPPVRAQSSPSPALVGAARVGGEVDLGY
jgi:hypothetical protein